MGTPEFFAIQKRMNTTLCEVLIPERGKYWDSVIEKRL
jgi:hypothetical protein